MANINTASGDHSTAHPGNDNNKDKYKHGWLTWSILILSSLFTLTFCCLIPHQYQEVIRKSNVQIKVDCGPMELSAESPIWFSLSHDSIATNRALDRTEVNELKALVDDSCDYYNEYIRSINELAYKSNNDTQNIYNLSILTFFFVFLGCSVRTFFDFIGCYCYKGEQDMGTWWPWYCLRPIICAPVTAIIIVSVRTSFFSNLFVAKDLNSYLVISFFAGFAIIEFLSMLRRISKSIFYVEGIPNKHPTANNIEEEKKNKN